MRRAKILVREARVKDLEAIYQIGLIEEGFAVSLDTRFYGRDYIRDWIKNPGEDVLLVAEIKGEVVGFAFTSIMIGRWAMWENLAVVKEAQGQGVGEALTEEALKRIKRKGIDYIAGWIRRENDPALEFLKKQGFKEGYEFVWVERKTKPLWPEHKRDLQRLKKKL